MDYKEFIKNELSQFRLVLNACNVVGDDWREYMAIKIRLLQGLYAYENNPKKAELHRRVQPLVRIRNNKVVWHGKEQGDFLAKVPCEAFDLIADPEKSVIEPSKLMGTLQSAGKIKVYFPSENAELFKPSVVSVFQQLPEHISLFGLMFEVQLGVADVTQCYDRVLKCHTATVALYYSYSKQNLMLRARQLPTPEPEELAVQSVREVNKVKEPQKPNKVIRTPRRLQ